MRNAILASLLLACMAVIARDETGKVYLRSVPTGASILVVEFGAPVAGEEAFAAPYNWPKAQRHLRDTGQKTNSMVSLPLGNQWVILRLHGYEDALIEIIVDQEKITKPPVADLNKLTRHVDILFSEDDWKVFVDGKAALDADGKIAMTPCTIVMTVGKHDIVLTKDGFKDIARQVEVVGGETKSIEIKGKIERK